MNKDYIFRIRKIKKINMLITRMDEVNFKSEFSTLLMIELQHHDEEMDFSWWCEEQRETNIRIDELIDDISKEKKEMFLFK